MWNKTKSATLSIAVCFLFVAVLTVAVFLAPFIIKLWFTSFRGWNPDGAAMQKMLVLFSCCFYPSAPLAYITLYSLLKLLFNIKNDKVFVVANVKYLRRISWCCFIVALITLVGGFFYIPFLCVFVAAAFVGLMLRVVKNVMQNAAEIKAENELTI